MQLATHFAHCGSHWFTCVDCCQGFDRKGAQVGVSLSYTAAEVCAGWVGSHSKHCASTHSACAERARTEVPMCSTCNLIVCGAATYVVLGPRRCMSAWPTVSALVFSVGTGGTPYQTSFALHHDLLPGSRTYPFARAHTCSGRRTACA